MALVKNAAAVPLTRHLAAVQERKQPLLQPQEVSDLEIASPGEIASATPYQVTAPAPFQPYANATHDSTPFAKKNFVARLTLPASQTMACFAELRVDPGDGIQIIGEPAKSSHKWKSYTTFGEDNYLEQAGISVTGEYVNPGDALSACRVSVIARKSIDLQVVFERETQFVGMEADAVRHAQQFVASSGLVKAVTQFVPEMRTEDERLETIPLALDGQQAGEIKLRRLTATTYDQIDQIYRWTTQVAFVELVSERPDLALEMVERLLSAYENDDFDLVPLRSRPESYMHRQIWMARNGF